MSPRVQELQPSMIIAFSFCSFFGLVSKFFVAFEHVCRHAFATLSFVCEIFIFLYVGMDALDIEKWRFVSDRYGLYAKDNLSPLWIGKFTYAYLTVPYSLQPWDVNCGELNTDGPGFDWKSSLRFPIIVYIQFDQEDAVWENWHKAASITLSFFLRILISFNYLLLVSILNFYPQFSRLPFGGQVLWEVLFLWPSRIIR